MFRSKVPQILVCLTLISMLHFGVVQDAFSQESPETKSDTPTEDSFSVEGMLIDKKKYSFSISGPDQEHEFRLDASTVFAARISRPTFDWKNRTVEGIIPASAPDGRFPNNLKVSYSLSEQIFFRHRFESAQEMKQLTSTSPIQLDRLVLSRTPLKAMVTKEERPVWTNELRVTADESFFETTLDYEPKKIKADWPLLILEGFSLLDLKPYESDLFVNAKKVNGKWIAKRVEFSARQNLKSFFEQPKPKCLVIGDIVSFNYLPALIKELDGKVLVQHANANCQGSENHVCLHRWIGDCRNPDFKWDVIVFNFGQADALLDKATYQDNLKKCLKSLSRSGTRLVWVESTPVPYGYNDEKLEEGAIISEDRRFDLEFENPAATSLKPGRMKLQNRWAAEVLTSYPDVLVCPVWDKVKSDKSGRYQEWWYGKNVKFKYPQSIPLAKSIAASVVDALK